MASSYDVLIVGAGVFGTTAALALNDRGHKVAVVDPGPLPHPLAASTDISKILRIEYGSDAGYARLAERAREKWLEWNTLVDEPLYHETGIVMLTCAPMSPGSYEYENYQSLRRRGYEPERLNSAEIARRFPAWNAERYVDGYFHDQSGYVESGRAMVFLIRKAVREGVMLQTGQTAATLLQASNRVIGIRTHQRETFMAEHVVVAAGAWTPFLVPELAPVMRAVGQPVFHLKPAEPELFSARRFPVFSADVTNSGWYGFPFQLREGVVKMANHGPGRLTHPSDDERAVTDEEVGQLRSFLADHLPILAAAPIVYTRLCLYCDTLDEHFWIARDPDREGLTVAAGGSGHAFKFGPVLGNLVADAVEGKDNPYLDKFRWRTLAPSTIGQEASRYRG